MSERTPLEIAAILQDSMPICGRAAVIALRRQHAGIERLTALNSALTEKTNALVIENARLAEEIGSLTAERDTALAAVLAERNDISEQLREWADELGFEGAWRWKTPGGLLYRAAEMISDRSKA